LGGARRGGFHAGKAKRVSCRWQCGRRAVGVFGRGVGVEGGSETLPYRAP
jgi:hypothetical protein